jgi:hypothetical protein
VVLQTAPLFLLQKNIAALRQEKVGLCGFAARKKIKENKK